MARRKEGGAAGGGAESQAPTGDFSPDVKNLAGKELTSAPAADLGAPASLPASPVQAVRDRQSDDCAKLAKLAQKVRRMVEVGEGIGRDGNAAAALGSLVRATASIHEMERAALGLGGDAAAGRDKVILLPVPVADMAQWAAMAAQAVGVQPAPMVEQGRRVGPYRAADDE